LIVGDALLHMPHLGEAAALYSIEPVEESGNMSGDTVAVPATLYDRFLAWIDRKPEPEPERNGQPPAQPPQQPATEEYAAQMQARDERIEQLSAQIAAMEAERLRAGRVAHFAAELAGTSLAGNAETAELLASLPEAAAPEVLRQLKALAEQVRVSNLTAPIGASGPATPVDATEAIDAEARKLMAEKGIDYNAAIIQVAQRPEMGQLFHEARRQGLGGGR
jgi:hypothetical protein